MAIKSERLKKLEKELKDLEQWLSLGLVPKKDVQKHKDEMAALETKIVDEKQRLRALKESGEVEEFTPPKRGARQAYAEPQTLPEMEASEGNMTDAGIEMETETFVAETATGEESEEGEEQEEEEEVEDPFSDRNRWKRGVIEDPDADQW